MFASTPLAVVFQTSSRPSMIEEAEDRYKALLSRKSVSAACKGVLLYNEF